MTKPIIYLIPKVVRTNSLGEFLNRLKPGLTGTMYIGDHECCEISRTTNGNLTKRYL